MNGLLLRFLGVDLENAAQISGAQLVLRNTGALGWVALFAIGLGAMAWWSYRCDAREAISRRRRWVLTSLRVALFVLLLLILLRPVLALTVEGRIRRSLVTLVDVSASMRIQDPRHEAADLQRAAIARGVLDARNGLGQSLDASRAGELKLLPRVEVLKSVLKNEDLGLLKTFAKTYDLAAFAFGQEIVEFSAERSADGTAPTSAWLDRMDPQSPATALGDAVREIVTRKRGQPLAGIFIATDGANNTGTTPLEAARFARSEGIPLFLYGVGITSPRDLFVADVFSQAVAFEKDELRVTVRVRGQGMRGETADVVLRLGDEIVASKAVSFGDDSEMTVPLEFTPSKTGQFVLSATIAARDDEAVKDNNTASQRLEVIDSKVKVLFIERAPRWEFRFVQGVWLRDRRIELKCVLLEGDPVIAEAQGSPYLAKIPATREELFKFDLIVIGDVGAKDFSPEQTEALGDFVSKFGGSLLFLAGPRDNPGSFRGSVFEKMLPVELGEPVTTADPGHATTLELTPQGRAEAMLRLAASEEESAAIWKRFPKVHRVARVGRAKPAAQVLLHDTNPASASRHGRMPVIALQQYGLGQVLFIGTDNFWRWRRNEGDRFYPILWGQIAQKLGLHHLLGGSKRTQLAVDKKNYTTGESVVLFARLYESDFSPVKAEKVEASLTIAGAATEQALTLRGVPDQPGMYRGDFVATTVGTHRFRVESDRETAVEFSVTEPRFELGETAMNQALLEQMAETSGGAFFREETLHKLAETIDAKAERVQSVVDAELWASPLSFLLLLSIGSVEWALRKRAQLK